MMMPGRKSNAAAPCCVLVVLALLGGCASGGGKGSLSDATSEAAGGKEERGRGEGRTRTKNESRASDLKEDSYEYEEYDDSPYYESDLGPGESQVKARPHLVLWFSRSDLAGDTVDGFSGVALMYSGSRDTLSRYRGQLGLYYGRGILGSRQEIQDGIKNISEAGIEIGARRYFTGSERSVGFFMLAGIRFGGMWWSYVDSFESSLEDGETEIVTWDGVFYGTPYVGVGSSLPLEKNFEMGVNATAGFRWISNQTFQNMGNDLFKDVGEFSLNIEASFFF